MKTPVNKASRSLIAKVRNGALCNYAVGFLPGTLHSRQELSGEPPVPLPCLHQWQPKGDLGWPNPISVATADPGRQLLTVAARAARGCPLGPRAAAGPGLCRRPASHAAFQFMVEQECISQKPCLISPGDCWCLKPSTQILIWLAVRVSKMPINLWKVFFLDFCCSEVGQ